MVQDLDSVLELIWRHPLKRAAQDAIGRQIRLGITDETLLQLVLGRAMEESLCEVSDDDPGEPGQPRLICSFDLVDPESGNVTP